MEIADDSEIGYVLEVDLEYPESLHTTHSDYPLAPERKTVPNNKLSPYSQELIEKFKLPLKPTEKLVPNLLNKTHYIVHYRNLKLYLSQGMKLTNIHRMIQFRQEPWLASYIILNTQLRTAATNSFQRLFYKLMNNACFGKTIEQLRNRSDIRLVTEEKKLKKLVSKSNFELYKIFHEKFMAVKMRKVSIKLDRPIYCGFSVLDLSKELMYDYFYNTIKARYGANVDLCFTDTDSVLLDVRCEDVYRDMHAEKDLYDFGNYPRDHELFSKCNDKVVGKFKDETAGVPIREFVGLKAKMYSILYDGKEKKTAKGISKRVVEKKIRHVDYRNSLFEEQQTVEKQMCIRGDRHELFTICVSKKALCPLDTKRYVLDDKIHTLAFGHKDIVYEDELD